MGSQTRTSDRVAARFRVDYVHGGNYLISYSRNISVDGIYLRTERPAPVGTCLKLVFSVEELHEMTLAARVIWVSQPGSSAEPGMGLRFLDPPPTFQDAILALVKRIAILDPADAPDEPGTVEH